MLKKCIFLLFCVSLFHLNSEETVATLASTLKEHVQESNHSLKLNNQDIHYKAIAGNLILKNEQDNPKASLFYTAYFKEGVENSAKRAIVFCFNGGPGSSSVWLHMGLLGPKRVVLNEKGESLPPFQYEDNPYSFLDKADLVFIDPVSTGFSKVAAGVDASQYHGVDEDINSIAEFIRQFITKYERWDSPKFLAGESYGTTRACGLVNCLHNTHHIYFNGVILVSCVLNFQTIFDPEDGNDLPYPLYLPTMTAAAFYHQKLNENLQKDFNATIDEVKKFAMTDYTLALMQGRNLSIEDKNKIIEKISTYTSLSKDFIERSDLRIDPFRFRAELLKDQEKSIGRFDARIVGDSLDPSGNYACHDPSMDAVAGAFTATFNQYLRKDLKVSSDQEYKILAGINANWNYGKTKNQFLNMAPNLQDTMKKNEALKVFVASGFYDLATPFFAADYTFKHLRLKPQLQDNVTMKYYHAGHMMFTHKESLVQLKNDLSEWISRQGNLQ